MKSDPIVDEVRKVRDEMARKVDYDLDALVADIKSRESINKDRVVRRPAKPSRNQPASEKPAA